MFVGGALVDFFGKIRMMIIYLISFILLVLIVAIFKSYWGNPFFIPGFIFSYYALATFINIAIFAAAMELCWRRISATQFTLYMAIFNVGRAVGAGILGWLKDYFESWDYVIVSFALFSLVMLILIRRMNLKSHLSQIELLESNY